jgi:glycosyltransferase involved in cell wall biosynthesis
MADVFVMPRWAEGFGFTNVEALSFGLPVISSRLGSVAQVIDHEVRGFLVPPGGVSAIPLAMERSTVDQSLDLRMGGAARAAFLARFTLERFQAGIGRVYQEALGG